MPETRAMAGELAKWAVGLPTQEASVEEPEAAADFTPDVQEPATAIRAAVAKLKADGQEVNGTTYGRLVGVSARTGRRDLQLLAA
ncbi:hypothetical protein [Streptomyces sp. URMC 124]|uniref:hypothetical protein n=1 Tax=Streptomyces sp. URMC 124 TaxID=3423405 RepID=UPI003F1B3482